MSSSYKPVSYRMTWSAQRPNFLDTDGTLLLSAYISRLNPLLAANTRCYNQTSAVPVDELRCKPLTADDAYRCRTETSGGLPSPP